MLFSILLQLISSWLPASCSVFGLGVSWFFCFVLHGRSGIFEFFFLRSSTCFPVKTQFFRRPFIFCTFSLYHWGFENAPARGSPSSIIGHIMTSRDYRKIEQVRTWLLSSSLAEFEQFYSECFFQLCFIYVFLATWFMFSFCPWGLVVLLFCSPCDDGIFCFFGLKFSNCFRVETHFFRRSFIFCTFSL